MSTLNSDSVDKSSESVGSYSFIHDWKSRMSNSSSPDFIPDAKWLLNYNGLDKGFSLDQLNGLEADAKILAANYVNGNAKGSAGNRLIDNYCNADPKKVAALCSDIPLKHFCSHRKSNGDSWLLAFESTINGDLLSNAHLMGLDSCNCHLFERSEKLCSDLDSHWIGVKKIEPWWDAVDKDDLASLVSQTSSHHIRNSNHPGVPSMNVEKVPENCVCCFDQFEEQMMDKEAKFSHVAGCVQRNLACKDNSLVKQGLMESILPTSDETLSLNTAKVDSSETQEPSSDLSRTELLEALCHSQTRAREAEKLAQKACDEKDRIVNLFFQQASCLFAYRQCLRLLQLETLCYHLSSKDGLASLSSPFQNKGMMLRKNRYRVAKKKSGKQRCNVSRCMVAFAIGLSLAGAGLLVGWTIGWLFPAL